MLSEQEASSGVDPASTASVESESVNRSVAPDLEAASSGPAENGFTTTEANDEMPDRDGKPMGTPPKYAEEWESHRDQGPDPVHPAPSTSVQETEKHPTDQPGSGPGLIHEMHKFSVYMTASKFYIVGGDLTDDRFRVLKIDRMADAGDLSLTEDGAVYTKAEMNQLLSTIDDGNRSTGGLKLRCSAWGLLGFIRFTGPYYMLLVTKRSQVAMIGGHYIYQIDGTELVSLARPATSRFKSDRHPEESRFLSILNNLDLTRSFYFSYSYNITRTLQRNIIYARQNHRGIHSTAKSQDLNDMFVWNHYLLEPAVKILESTLDWCLPIMHGYVDQSTLSIYGRAVYITIIARRSRCFAGARFLKRGTNDQGYVANDVETEQIISDMLTTSFHAPGPKPYANWNYTSYVQHRGSIPVFWTQDTTGVTPKPPIELNLIDPFYAAAALHFDNLFDRYGAPIYVLNLVKARERTPRESKLLNEFTNAITYLNQFLPDDKKVLYKAWDMSRASKSRDQDVIGTLEAIAEEVLSITGFFRNGDGWNAEPTLQQGVARTNCIDCLDRTNAAQFVIGKRALGHQLHALGVISEPVVEYDTDTVNLFTHMFHDHGDTLAVQYGGSHLVNTMETYRKINKWTSHSRDMVESFKRYYHNSFLDSQRQEAYNLFLGNYIFAQGQPMLWDLSTDYYLHHSDPRKWSSKQRRSYIDWFTPEFLRAAEMPPVSDTANAAEDGSAEPSDDYWLEYYRPLAVSSFLKLFSLRMNSTLKYIPFKPDQEGGIDPSPFRVRSAGFQDSPRRTRSRKGTASNEPCGYKSDDASSLASRSIRSEKLAASHWSSLPQMDEKAMDGEVGATPEQGTLAGAEIAPLEAYAPVEKSPAAQRTLESYVHDSLNPTITRTEAEEYQRYLDHPHNLPLVVSTDMPPNPSLDFLQYLNSVTPEAVADLHCAEEDLALYTDYLTVSDNPLTVTEADAPKKRYKAYRQWLKGKSLFKQQRAES